MVKETYEEQYKKMTETPIPKLVLSMGVSTTVTMLITSIYNMADTYFVSGINISASGATGVVLALMSVIQALAYWFGHGAGCNIGQLLGGGNLDRAKRMSATAFYIGLAVALAVLGFGIAFQTQLMYLLGSTETILPYAMDYSFYILLGAPGMISGLVLSVILRYEGHAFFGMVGLGIGGVLNIFGDYFMIRVLGFGIEGAGIATCVCQYISMIILIAPFVRGQVQSSINPKYITPEKMLIAGILALGFPSLIRQGIRSVSEMTLNHCAAFVGGDPAVSAMTIVARITYFMYCIAVGIGQGFQPVSGFNYGARVYSRVRKAYFFTMCVNIVLMAAIGLFGYFNAAFLISLFRDDAEVLVIGVFALQLRCAVIPCCAVTISTNMLHQSTGKAFRATILALFVGGLFFIPLCLILSQVMGVTGLQMAQPAADILGCLGSIPFAAYFMKKLPADGKT